jgi:hypothetical protein
MAESNTPKKDARPPSSPYGPQRGQVDEAAGGADSSPYETQPSGEKADAAAQESTRRKQARDESGDR